MGARSQGLNPHPLVLQVLREQVLGERGLGERGLGERDLGKRDLGTRDLGTRVLGTRVATLRYVLTGKDVFPVVLRTQRWIELALGWYKRQSLRDEWVEEKKWSCVSLFALSVVIPREWWIAHKSSITVSCQEVGAQVLALRI